MTGHKRDGLRTAGPGSAKRRAGVTGYPSGGAAEVRMAEAPATAGPFRHAGFCCRTANDYAITVGAFLRIIHRVQAFVSLHAGQQVPYAGEPIWASRTPAELREATRHEALINLAFAGGAGAGAEYAGPFGLPSSRSAPLPARPDAAMIHTYRSDLSQVRALVLKSAREAGLPEDRANDLVLAVSEVAANTLRHTPSPGTLAIWHGLHEIVCEIHDDGVITDPLAGRRRPAPDALGGHGLWLVHQVCDLVELRSDNTGTTIRMHMAIRSPRPLR